MRKGGGIAPRSRKFGRAERRQRLRFLGVLDLDELVGRGRHASP